MSGLFAGLAVGWLPCPMPTTATPATGTIKVTVTPVTRTSSTAPISTAEGE